MEKEGTTEKQPFKVWQGLGLVAHITSYIFVPLLLFGGIGLWLDRILNGHRFIFLAFCVFAFFASNYLVYRKAVEISKRYR